MLTLKNLFAIFSLLALLLISCKESKVNDFINFEYNLEPSKTDSLTIFFPFLQMQDTLKKYFEMNNIIGADTVLEDYDWDLLTFEKILYASRNNAECIIIGNLWGSKRAAVLFGTITNNGFKKIFTKQINIIDSIKKNNFNELFIFEIESFYQTYCQRQISYSLLVYKAHQLFEGFSALKAENIINNDSLCAKGTNFNTIFNLFEKNKLICLSSKKFYSENEDTLVSLFELKDSIFIKVR